MIMLSSPRNEAVCGWGADVWSWSNWVCGVWLVFWPMFRGRSVLYLPYQTTATSVVELSAFSASTAKCFLSQNNGKPLNLKCTHWLCFVVEALSLVGCQNRLCWGHCCWVRLKSLLKPFMLFWLKGDKATPTHCLAFHCGPGNIYMKWQREHSNHALSHCDLKLVWLSGSSISSLDAAGEKRL